MKNVGDLRYAPFLKIESDLKEKASVLHVFDPLIEKSEYNCDNLDTVLNHNYDIILIGCPHDSFFDEGILDCILSKNKAATVIDPFNCMKHKKITNKKIVIGNGQ